MHWWLVGRRFDDYWNSVAENAAIEAERWQDMDNLERAVHKLRLRGADETAVTSIDKMNTILQQLEALDGRSDRE